MDNHPEEDSPSTSIGEDIAELETTFRDVKGRRKQLATKLETIITGMEVNFAEARQTEVQLQAINAYRQTLTDMEAAEGRRVGVKLKKQGNETASKHSAVVADFLSKMRGNLSLDVDRPPLNPEEAGSRLEEAFNKGALNPILDTELKTDPHDLES